MRSRDWRHELTRLLFADFDGQVRRIVALWSVRPASTCGPSLTARTLLYPGYPLALYILKCRRDFSPARTGTVMVLPVTGMGQVA